MSEERSRGGPCVFTTFGHSHAASPTVPHVGTYRLSTALSHRLIPTTWIACLLWACTSVSQGRTQRLPELQATAEMSVARCQLYERAGPAASSAQP